MGGWFGERLRAINGALGVRRYVVGGIVNGVLVAWGALQEGGMTAVIGIPTWVVVVFTISGLLLWWFLGRIVELERERKPLIEFSVGTAPPYVLEAGIFRGFIHCVGIRNTGLHSLSGVRVSLETIDDGPHPDLPIRLRYHKTNDDNTTLHAGESDYVCVGAVTGTYRKSDGTKVPAVRIICHDLNRLVDLPMDSFGNTGRVFQLSAFGQGTSRSIARLRVQIAEHEQEGFGLRLSLLPSA